MQGSVSGRRAVLSIWFYQGQKSLAAAQTRFLSLTLPVQQSLWWQDASFPLQQWLHRPEKLFNLFGTTNLQRQGTLRTFLSFVILFHVFLFPSLIFFHELFLEPSDEPKRWSQGRVHTERHIETMSLNSFQIGFYLCTFRPIEHSTPSSEHDCTRKITEKRAQTFAKKRLFLTSKKQSYFL